MEQQSIISTFKAFLAKRDDFCIQVVPLRWLIKESTSGDDAHFLKTCETICQERKTISDWKGYANEQYFRLWYLGIAQLVYCVLNHGKLCEEPDLLKRYFCFLFKNVSFDLPTLPKLPVLALRDNEKKHLQEHDFSQLVLDIDMAPHPENKLKYVCHYLYNEDDTRTLAELLDFYAGRYALPIDASILVNYWVRKRLRGADDGCMWKALRGMMREVDNQVSFGKGLVIHLDGDEFGEAMSMGLATDLQAIEGNGTSRAPVLYCTFLTEFAPLAEAILELYGRIPQEDWNYYDERLCLLANQSVALKQSQVR